MRKVVYFLRRGSVTKLCLTTDRTRVVIKHGSQLVLPWAVLVSRDAFQGWKEQVRHNTVTYGWSSTLSSSTKFHAWTFYSSDFYFLFRKLVGLNSSFKNTLSVKKNPWNTSFPWNDFNLLNRTNLLDPIELRIQHNILRIWEASRAQSPVVRALMGKGNQETRLQISTSILIQFQSYCLGYPIPQ